MFTFTNDFYSLIKQENCDVDGNEELFRNLVQNDQTKDNIIKDESMETVFSTTSNVSNIYKKESNINITTGYFDRSKLQDSCNLQSILNCENVTQQSANDGKL